MFLVGVPLIAAVALLWIFAEQLFPALEAELPPNPIAVIKPREPDEKPPTEFAFPLVQAPLRSLDSADPFKLHPLILHPEHPPTVIGYSQGSGLSSGRWKPSSEQLALTPNGIVLVLLGTTSKPGFTFNTRIWQQPWTGNVGLFWGYQEDAKIKEARQPDKDFARFQMLRMTEGRDAKNNMQFFVQRATGTLRFNTTGDVVASPKDLASYALTNFSGQTMFEVVVVKGQLRYARFGGSDMNKLCTTALNKGFQPGDYRGAFGFLASGPVAIEGPQFKWHKDD